MAKAAPLTPPRATGGHDGPAGSGRQPIPPAGPPARPTRRRPQTERRRISPRDVPGIERALAELTDARSLAARWGWHFDARGWGPCPAHPDAGACLQLDEGDGWRWTCHARDGCGSGDAIDLYLRCAALPPRASGERRSPPRGAGRPPAEPGRNHRAPAHGVRHRARHAPAAPLAAAARPHRCDRHRRRRGPGTARAGPRGVAHPGSGCAGTRGRGAGHRAAGRGQVAPGQPAGRGGRDDDAARRARGVLPPAPRLPDAEHRCVGGDHAGRPRLCADRAPGRRDQGAHAPGRGVRPAGAGRGGGARRGERAPRPLPPELPVQRRLLVLRPVRAGAALLRPPRQAPRLPARALAHRGAPPRRGAGRHRREPARGPGALPSAPGRPAGGHPRTRGARGARPRPCGRPRRRRPHRRPPRRAPRLRRLPAHGLHGAPATHRRAAPARRSPGRCGRHGRRRARLVPPRAYGVCPGRRSGPGRVGGRRRGDRGVGGPASADGA